MLTPCEAAGAFPVFELVLTPAERRLLEALNALGVRYLIVIASKTRGEAAEGLGPTTDARGHPVGSQGEKPIAVDMTAVIRPATNWRRMPIVLTQSRLQRLAALVLALVLTPMASAGVACAGWSSSAAGRHACCARVEAGCVPVSVDACCADGEQRQNAQVVAAIVITPGPLVSEPVPAVRAVPQSFVLDPHALAARPSIHLLDSVFLI
jgi:hypothetical protein